MAAIQVVKNVHKLQNDLFKELNTLTLGKFTFNVSNFVHFICDMKIQFVIQILYVLRHINKLDPHDPRRNRTYRNIVKLICSINNIDDADSHPIGQDLSIAMYAKIAQDLLNVKRFDSSKYAITATTTLDPIEEYIVNVAKLSYERIRPQLNDVIIHTHTKEKSWFRLKMNWNNKLEDIKMLANTAAIGEHLEGIALLEDNIIELVYSHHNLKLIDYIHVFNAMSIVDEIIFFSNLRLFKAKCECKLTALSNILKFYYCNVSKHANFIVASTEDLELFNKLYLSSVIMLHKDNLSISTDILSPNPIACLAGNGPSRTIRTKAMKIEPLSEYETMILNSTPEADLRGTSMSRESAKDRSRHVIATISQDRDSRIMHNQSAIAGCNMHELVLTIDEE